MVVGGPLKQICAGRVTLVPVVSSTQWDLTVRMRDTYDTATGLGGHVPEVGVGVEDTPHCGYIRWPYGRRRQQRRGHPTPGRLRPGVYRPARVNRFIWSAVYQD